MPTFVRPMVHTEGLKLWYDMASHKSYKGEPTLNQAGMATEAGTDRNFGASDLSGNCGMRVVMNGIGHSIDYNENAPVVDVLSGINHYMSYTRSPDGHEELNYTLTGNTYNSSFFPVRFFMRWWDSADTTMDYSGFSAGDVTVSQEVKFHPEALHDDLVANVDIGLYYVGRHHKETSPKLTSLKDGWTRMEATFAYTGTSTFNCYNWLYGSNRQYISGISYRKPQIEQKSYATNFVSFERSADSGCMFNLVNTGLGQMIFVNEPTGFGAHKIEGSNVMAPMINARIGFNGVDSYSYAHENLDSLISNLGTIECWYRSPNSGTATAALIQLTDGATSNFMNLSVGDAYPGLNIDGNFQHRVNGGGSSAMSATGYYQGHHNDGAYHQLVARVDGINNCIFWDGQKQDTIYRSQISRNSTIFTNNGSTNSITSLSLGGRYYPDTQVFENKGPFEIAVVRIYTKGLSDKEILQNYNATKARFGL